MDFINYSLSKPNFTEKKKNIAKYDRTSQQKYGAHELSLLLKPNFKKTPLNKQDMLATLCFEVHELFSCQNQLYNTIAE